MKTLICLLSAQPVPNLMSCKTLRPERIVLVETSKMQKLNVAINFQNALKKMKIDVETRVVNVPEGKDNNFPFLTNFFDTELRQAFLEDHFFLNLTGATKPMSIALYETFQNHPQAEFYYFDVDHPCEIIEFRKYKSFPVGQIPLDAFLAGYGYQTSKEAKHVNAAENIALSRTQTTNLLAQKCNADNFRIWASGMRDWIVKAQKKSSSILTPGILVPSHPEIAAQLAKQFKLQKCPDGSLLGKITKYDIKYLDGGWLEEFVWITLNQFKKQFQLKDLHLGQEIQKNGSKNDLDVSFMRDNTFYVLECKTGLQEKMQENQYKLFAVSKQLQAIGTKTFLISNSDKLSNQDVQDRAQLHSTTLIDAEKIHQMALDPEKELDKFFNPPKK